MTKDENTSLTKCFAGNLTDSNNHFNTFANCKLYAILILRPTNAVFVNMKRCNLMSFDYFKASLHQLFQKNLRFFSKIYTGMVFVYGKHC